MSILMFEKQLIGNLKKTLKEGERLVVRRQQCMGCHHVLALQIASELDRQSQADYYVVRDCMWIAGEPQLLYKKERWFGNPLRCPVCGRQGKLPMDKPLSWELMQETKEKRNALQNSN